MADAKCLVYLSFVFLLLSSASSSTVTRLRARKGVGKGAGAPPVAPATNTQRPVAGQALAGPSVPRIRIPDRPGAIDVPNRPGTPHPDTNTGLELPMIIEDAPPPSFSLMLDNRQRSFRTMFCGELRLDEACLVWLTDPTVGGLPIANLRGHRMFVVEAVTNRKNLADTRELRGSTFYIRWTYHFTYFNPPPNLGLMDKIKGGPGIVQLKQADKEFKHELVMAAREKSKASAAAAAGGGGAGPSSAAAAAAAAAGDAAYNEDNMDYAGAEKLYERVVAIFGPQRMESTVRPPVEWGDAVTIEKIAVFLKNLLQDLQAPPDWKMMSNNCAMYTASLCTRSGIKCELGSKCYIAGQGADLVDNLQSSAVRQQHEQLANAPAKKQKRDRDDPSVVAQSPSLRRHESEPERKSPQ